MYNHAFIDGQNLHLGTTKAEIPWKIDFARFRCYLSQKYHVIKAFYFLGYEDVRNKALYDNIRKAGFILIFREHDSKSSSMKKGNVDTDIVFMMMRNFIEESNLGKIFLISGDGDYFRAVKYLCRKGRFGKVLFPNHKYSSSLYKILNDSYHDYLDAADTRTRICMK